MNERLLLCTDLDRTLLPNGVHPESPGARERFRTLAARSEITLAYVTGRHRALVEKAISSYALPLPDYVIGDVGTTIYEISPQGWIVWSEWQREIAPDWAGMRNSELRALFADLSPLRLQEAAKQNTFKISYYVPLYEERTTLLAEMESRLETQGVHASLIWSIDEPAGIGLLDVLPARATKLHGIEFLMEHRGFGLKDTVFAGDSGNDLPVLTSPIPAVLVRNAAEDVRSEALREAKARGTDNALYLAEGDFEGMNGNYSAGILQGLAHYHPQTREWWRRGV